MTKEQERAEICNHPQVNFSPNYAMHYQTALKSPMAIGPLSLEHVPVDCWTSSIQEPAEVRPKNSMLHPILC